MHLGKDIQSEEQQPLAATRAPGPAQEVPSFSAKSYPGSDLTESWSRVASCRPLPAEPGAAPAVPADTHLLPGVFGEPLDDVFQLPVETRDRLQPGRDSARRTLSACTHLVNLVCARALQTQRQALANSKSR